MPIEFFKKKLYYQIGVAENSEREICNSYLSFFIRKNCQSGFLATPRGCLADNKSVQVGNG
ncbi:MAG: hypothetical protein D6814_10420 [Calditrichaeota bacterium]|nr:MAG: hypothetical protein D6814_10420 [Calditrichota bacterium]